MVKVAEDRPGVIYGLRYRSGDQYRYVGFAVNPRRRLTAHANNARKGSHLPVHDWMRRLGVEAVVMDVLEDCIGQDALCEGEIRWIAKLGAEGHPLLNMTPGGFGAAGLTDYSSPKWQQAFADGMKERNTFRGGTIHEWRAQNPETAAETVRRVAKLVGITRSPETRAKMAAAQKARRNKERNAIV